MSAEHHEIPTPRSVPTEEALGRSVVAWLTAAGWTCYQEVEVHLHGTQGGPRADIVAVRDGLVWIVELKVRLSWDVLEQAEAWEGWAHRRSVATALGPRHAAGRTAGRALTALGLGWIHANGWTTGGTLVLGEVRERVEAPTVGALEARRAPLLLDQLRPEHQTAAAAGSTTGGHWTRWRETCRALADAVAAEPGLELGQYVARIAHHYASTRSAVSSLAMDVERGRIDAVRGCGGRGRHLVLGHEETTFSGRESGEETTP